MSMTGTYASRGAPTRTPVRMADGYRMIVRGVQRLLGASLALAALGLWFAPGASWESDVMLFKLILSLTAIFAAVGLLSASSRPAPPEIEIDIRRRQVRLVRRPRGAAPVLLQRCDFNELSSAEREGSIVRLWDSAGVLLAEISLTEPETMSELVAGLREEGKLA
ncbi:hypothetical protein AB2B41_02925 [Marimonas sp. MJW-29]|uniref:PH domain-containing protein n=1 Tax=Sulfitobacter sediminis TaxID=3234186 RepID=A0ABV3RIS7_9RHOB